ncbi:LLM class flavin-dependent oxidoreductase [Mycobacterium sp. HNNTM2301]|uniref:LLM class flavin-dependent oxidoreductase n=1 Tax=Mycobacterium hainanense TaxID=3289775 RepID=UPI0035A5D8AF
MRFGVELPTCTAGMMHPVPFATAGEIVDTAVEAEQLGYYDVGGNDHLSTMDFVRKAWPRPPDYFEPLITLATVAARTSVLRLTTGIMVLPMRDPVLLAKQIATLDQLSNGRVTLGTAVGGYRDEFEAVKPDKSRDNRAEITRETIEAIRAIWDQRRASYSGRHVHFEDVESYPKPVQHPLPIYSGGNADGSLRRAAEFCQGWLPAKIGPEAIAEGRKKIAAYAESFGRSPRDIVIALQSVVCLGKSAEDAREIFLNSSFDLFRKSLQHSMTKGIDLDTYLATNLVGSPDEVCEKVAAYQRAGLDHMAALLFVGNTVDEMREQIRRFACEVLPNFPDNAAN